MNMSYSFQVDSLLPAVQSAILTTAEFFVFYDTIKCGSSFSSGWYLVVTIGLILIIFRKRCKSSYN